MNQPGSQTTPNVANVFQRECGRLTSLLVDRNLIVAPTEPSDGYRAALRLSSCSRRTFISRGPSFRPTLRGNGLSGRAIHPGRHRLPPFVTVDRAIMGIILLSRVIVSAKGRHGRRTRKKTTTTTEARTTRCEEAELRTRYSIVLLFPQTTRSISLEKTNNSAVFDILSRWISPTMRVNKTSPSFPTEKGLTNLKLNEWTTELWILDRNTVKPIELLIVASTQQKK